MQGYVPLQRGLRFCISATPPQKGKVGTDPHLSQRTWGRGIFCFVLFVFVLGVGGLGRANTETETNETE